MKWQIVWLLAVLVFIGFSSCSDDSSETDDLYSLIVSDKIPTQLIEKENLPGWLVKVVDEAEMSGATIPVGVRPARIYQLQWNFKKYYMLYDAYNSYIFYDVYTENGEHVEWNVYDSSDFVDNSTDWFCIYVIRK